MTHSNGFFSLVTVAMLLFSVDASTGWFGNNKSGWSDAEKRNFCHFLNSQKAWSQAARIVNATDDYATEQQVTEMRSLWRQALEEASQVSDVVLDKVNSGLRQKYRSEYQRGLEYKIAAFEQRNMSFAVMGSKMISDYIDWFQSTEYRVPKGTAAACRIGSD